MKFQELPTVWQEKGPESWTAVKLAVEFVWRHSENPALSMRVLSHRHTFAPGVEVGMDLFGASSAHELVVSIYVQRPGPSEGKPAMPLVGWVQHLTFFLPSWSQTPPAERAAWAGWIATHCYHRWQQAVAVGREISLREQKNGSQA